MECKTLTLSNNSDRDRSLVGAQACRMLYEALQYAMSSIQTVTTLLNIVAVSSIMGGIAYNHTVVDSTAWQLGCPY